MSVAILLSSVLIIPMIGFLITLCIPAEKEKLLASISLLSSSISVVVFIGLCILWIRGGFNEINEPLFSLYEGVNYQFVLQLYYDKTSAVFGLVGAVITFAISYFSRFYMHREQGYKRFFLSILFFYFGYNFILISGNFETLFMGWEVIGISSFLLVAFYRDRYLPVKNAVKVFSIYRIADVGLILAMWLSHHLWHENINFAKIDNSALVDSVLSHHSITGFFISLFILMAAMAKSAQFPFSSWLPRAMEGPTPSSAIFYGALSVHFGVFLLIRTFPFWEHQLSIRILIVLVGLATIIASSMIAKVQSSMKAQIAYASLSQIGFMFIEVAVGLEDLALIHFAGNAFLRSYQLLVSPSAVTYLLREQLYQNEDKIEKNWLSISDKWKYKLFVFNLREWNLDLFLNNYVFSPLKKIGRNLDFITMKNLFIYYIPLYVFGWLIYFFGDDAGMGMITGMPYFFSFLGLIMVLKSFSERKDPILAWTLLYLNHLFVSLSVTFNEHFNLTHTAIYLSGVSLAFAVGIWVLYTLKRKERAYFTLNRFYGHVYEYTFLHSVFLISCLGLMCFPISPSFLGVDLSYSHIHENQFFLALFNALGFVVGGISIIRLYARIFLGPHIKTYHSTSNKTA